MRLNSWHLLCGTAFLISLMAGMSQTQAADSVQIMVTATAINPPCTIDVPPVVYLGSIHYGEKRYRPIDLTVNCESPSLYVVYAQAGGNLVSGSSTTMEMSGADTLAHFWLEESGKPIKLNGESNLTDSGFCNGTSSQTCAVTPATRVDNKAQKGDRGAVIKFSIRYTA
ncbi:hypothetical protein F9N64_19710 [Salmonella enterica]|uniref:hypothetical protein n=1 Tax=Salmonella enterica TaxID=28901 RepID=UPI0009AE834E|nr:hypothetical protein [Salmonella enterica]EDV7203291.1 hypothetical protein [Salmonella enterica subsp. enterica serovar Bredeney]EDX9716468.1 hypothetical protein [Salmonella enterica subsp. salamae]EGU9002791.1 hypothetical protein [Salmonella enterica]